MNYYGLVNKPPIDEIYNLSIVNKPDLDSEEIKHFGILGMKWGVRRYQNPDGTLTEAGKRKLYKLQSKKERKVAKRIEKARKREFKKEEKLRRNKQKILSDPKLILKYQHMLSSEEVSKARDRIKLMNEIRDLKKTKLDKGKAYVDSILGYGKTANDIITFINSNAGKAIRQSLGLSTKDWMKFNKDEPKKDDKK